MRGRGATTAIFHSALIGRHQVENAATAIAACWVISRGGFLIPEAAIRTGLSNVSWPGRFELLRNDPTVIVDGAHNVDSSQRLAETLADEYGGHHLTLILGIADDKDVEQMVGVLAPIANRIIATASRHPRAAKAERIVAAVEKLDPPLPEIVVAPDVPRGVRNALGSAGRADVICATGSLYVVAETREALGLAQSDEFERELLYR